MKNIAITGATSGVGLEIKKQLEEKNEVFNLSRANGYNLLESKTPEKVAHFVIENDIDTLFLNSGILFNGLIGTYDLDDIDTVTTLNYTANAKIINLLWDRIEKNKTKVVVTLSSAAYINGASEAFYSTSKKALKEFIFAANTELRYKKVDNNIFIFAPPFIEGTKMTSSENKPTEALTNMIESLLKEINANKDFYMPKYEEIYKRVFNEYKKDPIKQGLDSIEYRKSNGRWNY